MTDQPIKTEYQTSRSRKTASKKNRVTRQSFKNPVNVKLSHGVRIETGLANSIMSADGRQRDVMWSPVEDIRRDLAVAS